MGDEIDLRLVGPSDFEPLIGTDFVSSDPPARFLLTQVTALGVDHNGPREQPFTLTFVSDARLVQATYELEHASLGRLAIFLVPIGLAPNERFLYEAVFN